MPYIIAILAALDVWSLYLLYSTRKDISLMATQADLDAVLTKIEDKITTLGTDLQKTLADLAAKIAAGSTPADLQPEVDRANAIADKLADFDTETTTADAS